jgi:argininosuccinate lyase
MSLLTIGRSLFMGYNRDTQWTKYLIMDLVEECVTAPQMMAEIISTLQMEKKKMAVQSQKGFIGAPDLLEWLVQKWGIPFRRAKVAMEKAVKYSENEGQEKVSFPSLKRAFREADLDYPLNEKMMVEVQEPAVIVSRRKAVGGTAPEALQKNILSLTRFEQNLQRWLSQTRKQQSLARTRLAEMEGSL